MGALSRILNSIRRQAAVAGLLVVVVAGCAWGDAPTAAVHFGLFTDLHAHDLDSPLEGKWMTHTETRLSAFVDVMNAANPDFVIQLGDFVNGWVILGADPGDPARIPGILAWADSLYAAFRGPRYHVLGNHDVYNLDKQQWLDILRIPRTFYSFDADGFHFVVLDVQFAEDGSDLASTYTGVAGSIPAPELAWLKEDLALSGQPTVVFVHQPLDTYVEAWGRTLVANQAEVTGILSADPDVIAVFQGHDHANRHTVQDGVHYITFEALVDQGTSASWALVTLDPIERLIRIEGVGDQADAVYRYVVRRSE